MDQKAVRLILPKALSTSCIFSALQRVKHTEVGDAEKYSIHRLKISSYSIIKIMKMHEVSSHPLVIILDTQWSDICLLLSLYTNSVLSFLGRHETGVHKEHKPPWVNQEVWSRQHCQALLCLIRIHALWKTVFVSTKWSVLKYPYRYMSLGIKIPILEMGKTHLYWGLYHFPTLTPLSPSSPLSKLGLLQVARITMAESSCSPPPPQLQIQSRTSICFTRQIASPALKEGHTLLLPSAAEGAQPTGSRSKSWHSQGQDAWDQTKLMAKYLFWFWLG